MNSIDSCKESIAFFNSFPRACKTSKVAGITSAVTYAFARIAQIFTRTSDDRQWELYSNRIKAYTFSSSKKFNITFQNVNAGLFFRLSNKKFISLLKNGAVLYFKQKIENGEESLDSLNKKFNVESGSLDALFAMLSIKEICSIIPLEDLVEFIEESNLRGNSVGFKERKELRVNWREFHHVTQLYIDSKATRILEKCQKKFIRLFSENQLREPSSWKIFLAKQLVDLSVDRMPAFARNFLANLKSGLPDGYEQKVRLFRTCIKGVVSVVERKILAVRARVFEGIPIPVLSRPSLDKSESEFITDAAESCLDFKYTEHFPIKPLGREGESFEIRYQGDIIIARIIMDCFQAYKDVISEDDFHEAYKKWNQMDADPKALDKLVNEKIEEVRMRLTLDSVSV